MVLKEPKIRDLTIPVQPQLTASAQELVRGEQLYNVSCSGCHGPNARSGGVIPDLRMMAPETHKIFKNIVVDGVYAGKGMAGYGDILNEKDTEIIRQYVISRALIDKAEADALENSAGGR